MFTHTLSSEITQKMSLDCTAVKVWEACMPLYMESFSEANERAINGYHNWIILLSLFIVTLEF